MTAASRPATIHPARKIAAPELMSEAVTVEALWESADAVGVSACTVLGTLHEVVSGHAQLGS